MTGFYQPQPDSTHSGYKQTNLDNLSDEEIQKLLNQCGVRVAPQQKPPVKGYVDLGAQIEYLK